MALKINLAFSVDEFVAPSHRCNGAIRRPEPWELAVLRLVAEQGAIQLDQLARFLGCPFEEAIAVAEHLGAAGYAECRHFLVGEPPWFWLRERGARFSETGLRPYCPRLGALARMRAVNEVRLKVSRQAPGAQWISGRTVVKRGGTWGPRVSAIVEIGAERHAILVKHGLPQEERRECRILETHMDHYDAVVAFANLHIRTLLRRLHSEHYWPKLIVRSIPQPPPGWRLTHAQPLGSPAAPTATINQ